MKNLLYSFFNLFFLVILQTQHFSFQALASRFPGGMVQIKTFTSKSPTLVFDGAKGVAAIESLVEAYVQVSLVYSKTFFFYLQVVV